MQDSQLFSADVVDRYSATLATDPAQRYPWPRACYGAANAWVLLVGPSPGKQDPREAAWPGGPGRPKDCCAGIGPEAGVIHFSSQTGRNQRWQWLIESAFETPAHARALTALANLDWGHNPDHRTIPDAYLHEGCGVVFDLMRDMRPRIVVALMRRTWDIFSAYLRTADVSFYEYSPKTTLDTLVFELPGFGAKTLLLRSPQHPSRHFFTVRHAGMIREETRHFLSVFPANER